MNDKWQNNLRIQNFLSFTETIECQSGYSIYPGTPFELKVPPGTPRASKVL